MEMKTMSVALAVAVMEPSLLAAVTIMIALFPLFRLIILLVIMVVECSGGGI
jgi:hypothetical protein